MPGVRLIVQFEADSAFGFDYDEDFLRYLQDTDKTSGRWKKLDRFSPVVFWYRQSPRPLQHLGTAPGVSVSDPPLQFSGETLVQLDSEGRLRAFEAIPPQREAASTGPSSAPDWSLDTGGPDGARRSTNGSQDREYDHSIDPQRFHLGWVSLCS